MRGRADPRSDLYSLGRRLLRDAHGPSALVAVRDAGASRGRPRRPPRRRRRRAPARRSIRSLADAARLFARRSSRLGRGDPHAASPDAAAVAGGGEVSGLRRRARRSDVPALPFVRSRGAACCAHDRERRLAAGPEKLDDDPRRDRATLLRLLDPIAAPPEGPLQFITGARESLFRCRAEQRRLRCRPSCSASSTAPPPSLERCFGARASTFARHEGRSIGRAIRLGSGHDQRPRRLSLSAWRLRACGRDVTFARVDGFSRVALRRRCCRLSIGGSAMVRQCGRSAVARATGWACFRCANEIAAGPVADAVLAGAAGTLEAVRAPEVRALLGDVATELYRLTRRVEQLGANRRRRPSEVDLLRRTADAAPALIERLRRMAARLDDLDAALEGQSEGELMQAMARLERAAAAPGADRAALAASRRDLEATLERRHATEQERARLSAKLCQLLGQLRLVYRQAPRCRRRTSRRRCVRDGARRAGRPAAIAAQRAGRSASGASRRVRHPSIAQVQLHCRAWTCSRARPRRIAAGNRWRSGCGRRRWRSSSARSTCSARASCCAARSRRRSCRR